MEDSQQGDICRVCRCEGTSDKPLYHPCVCTGSIKFIHQDCLVQWLRYSKKEYCELCKHKFAFKPIYAPDMPKRLPIQDILTGLVKSVGHAVRYWFHYTLVAVAWLGVVPLTACRIYRALFTGSVNSLLTLPLDMLSTENLVSDSFQGCFVVTCTLCAFISLVWLREQILHGGGPDWLEQDPPQPQQPQPQNNNNVLNNNIPDAGGGGDGGGAAGGDGGEGEPAAAAVAPEAGAEEAQQVVAQPEQDPNAVIAGVVDAAVQQDEIWNPIEWDRAAEELTWERLLGLDGSLVFLEHVFWVVSLNTLFILVFAFCPYHIGNFTVAGLKLESYLHLTQFEGLITTLIGYWIISITLVLLHCVASVFRFRRSDIISRSKRILGLCYVVVKVSLLVVVEIGIFPLVCGWWLDICSLSMFDATLKEREASFKIAPGTSMFIHWLVGMVYVFYFASFILLLREVLRPGVLWFLRNLNDPDFNPIQEMIHLPIYRHIRRFLASMVIFGSTVLIMLWLPVKLIRWSMPGFLPYNVMLSSDAPVSELSLELLLLQVVLPALLEQGHTRHWLKSVVRGWCLGAAWLLDLRSYLLGEEQQHNEERQPNAPANNQQQPQQPQQQPQQQPAAAEEENNAAADDVALEEELAAPVVAPLAEEEDVPEEGEEAEEEEEDVDEDLANGGLAAAHQAMLQGGGPTGFEPYMCPSLFAFRLVALFVLMCITLFVASLVSYILPVYIGRRLMSLWMGGESSTSIHELYTAACGLYTCWLTLRAATVLYHWLPQGAGVILQKLQEWAMLIGKSVVVAVLLIGVVPLLLGLLFELVVVAPLRVPLDQTPVFFPWQDWALGVLHAKIVCAITMMGPTWWLKGVLERVYQQGLRHMDVGYILRSLCLPVLCVLSLCLAVPYVVAQSIVPALGFEFATCNLVLRRIYPFLLAVFMLAVFCVFQVKQFKKLYEHIKNDKYLVGQRLVNYERNRIRALESPPMAAAQ